MAMSINQHNPDYAAPPGWALEEHIEALGLSQAEFAGLCDLPTGTISEIVAGRAPITPQTASVFDRETALDESIWLNMETAYRNKLAELGEDAELAEWARKFPVKELVKRGDISALSLEADRVARMLSFFDVWSVDALRDKYGEASVAYRHSPSFRSNPQALAAWLRLGEIEAEGIECAGYDREAFLSSLTEARALTGSPGGQIFGLSQDLCRQSGVVLCFTKPLAGMAISGASYWLSDGKPVIQLSARHKTDDHLWFSLFHEAAHILLHSEERTFVDGIRGKSADGESGESEAESQADEWAQDFLIPQAHWSRFSKTFLGSEAEARLFAEEQGIAPGIVVGRLQRAGHVPWNRLNGLKRKLEWAEPPYRSASGG